MTSKTTKQAEPPSEQPPEQPSQPSDSSDSSAERPAEELRFRPPTLTAWERNPVTTRAMARRLPQLVRRSLALAWKVDRKAVVALLVCQALSGFFEAFGLLATTGTITALISSGQIIDRLREALPSIAVLAGAAGLRALLGIAVNNISSRLSPRISREAETQMLDAAINAELAAYDNPGFNDKWDAADRGAEVARDLITESQQLMACLSSLIAAAGVVTVLHPEVAA